MAERIDCGLPPIARRLIATLFALLHLVASSTSGLTESACVGARIAYAQSITLHGTH